MGTGRGTIGALALALARVRQGLGRALHGHDKGVAGTQKEVLWAR